MEETGDKDDKQSLPSRISQSNVRQIDLQKLLLNIKQGPEGNTAYKTGRIKQVSQIE